MVQVIRYPIEADANKLTTGVAAARQALGGLNKTFEEGKKAQEDWSSSQQRASMRMESLHEQALKMNTSFKSASDETQRTTDTMKAFDAALGGPISGTKALAPALDLAGLGFKNMSTSAAGFNVASAGVVGAGLAIGTTLGGLARQLGELDGSTQRLDQAFQDLWHAMLGGQTAASAVAGIADFQKRMANSNEEAVARQIEGMKRLGKTEQEIAEFYKGTEKVTRTATDRFIQEAEAHRKAEAATKAHAAEVKRLAEEQARATHQARMNILGAVLGPAGKAIGGTGSFDLGKGAIAGHGIQELPIGPNMAGLLDNVLPKSAWKFALTNGLKGALAEMPATILGVIRGGGNLGGALGTTLGGALGKSMEEGLSKSLSNVLGKTLGGALGALAPGVGGLVGGLAGKLIGGIGGLFGGGEGKQVNRQRDEFLAAQGGWQKLHQQLAAAGNEGLMQKIFDAKTLAGFNAVMNEATGLLGLHSQAQSELNAAAEKYGLVTQNQIEMQGLQLLKEHDLLETQFQSADVLAKMAPGINEYVQQALKAGQLIPANFKPILEQMASLGLLTDASGQAVDDLAGAGVNAFGEFSTATQDLVKELRELVKVLREAQGLGPVDVPEGGGGGGVRGGGRFEPLQRFATGGRVTAPRVAIVGDRPETIVPDDHIGFLAGAIARRMPGGSGSGIVLRPMFVVQIGNRQLSDVIVEERRLGNLPGLE